jgi:MFS-type transporter involved in bile tolerance (Atg22 family)
MVDQITGNMRYSVLTLIIFFIAGIVLLSKVKKSAVRLS